jgi:hypothetical protein
MDLLSAFSMPCCPLRQRPARCSDSSGTRLVDFFAADVPSPFAAVAIEHLGGAIGRVGEWDTAFSHRRAQHSCLVLRAWRDPAASHDNIAWGRSCYGAMEPFLEQGVYVNYLGDEGEGRSRGDDGYLNRKYGLAFRTPPRTRERKPSTVACGNMISEPERVAHFKAPTAIPPLAASCSRRRKRTAL